MAASAERFLRPAGYDGFFRDKAEGGWLSAIRRVRFRAARVAVGVG
jgi:hypothetical protein